MEDANMKRTLVLWMLGALVGCSDSDTTADPEPEIIRQAVCDPEGGGECCGSPIIIDVAGDGVRLTDPANGVSFSLRPGSYKRYSWTEAGSDDAWLALDRDGDGEIRDGSELFGNFTPQVSFEETKNGFIALRALDTNQDGQVSAEDDSYSSLRLWQDLDHDGRSQPRELLTLESVGITGISVVYLTTDWKSNTYIDEHGNLFAFEASVYTSPGSAVGMRAWDVYLANIRDPFLVAAESAGGEGAKELVLGMLGVRPTPNVPCWRCNARCPIRAKPTSGWSDDQCWYANGGLHNIYVVGPILKTYDVSTACLAAINRCQDSLSAPTTCETYGSGCLYNIVVPDSCTRVTCPTSC